jgi:hypothetical protein
VPNPALRARLLSPPVARAMTSASGILAAGGGTAVAVVAGLPVLGAVGVGAAAWLGRVALAVPRAKPGERIDPFALQDPWRRFTQQAQQAERRFEDAVRATRRGPLRDRMADLGDRVATGVEECWRIARAGHALSSARSRINPARVRSQLDHVRASTAGDPAPGSAVAGTIEALEAQLRSAERLEALVTDTRDRLRLLDARLDEAVTRAIELSVRSDEPDALRSLTHDVDGVVGEMEALRQALAETDAPPLA